jgi:hypothetical protein
MRYAATLALWVDALAVEPTGSGASISSGSAREEALGEKALGEKALREKALAMARRSWDWASCVARPASRPCCLRRCRPPLLLSSVRLTQCRGCCSASMQFSR